MFSKVFVRHLALGFIVTAGIASRADAQITSGQTTSRQTTSPWVSQDVGRSTPAGEFHIDNGQLTISTAAGQMQGPADRFSFVYQILSGDVRITARLDSLTPALLWSNAGLMIRSSLQPDAAHAAVIVRGDAGPALQTRTQNGALTMDRNTRPTGSAAPQWIGLERAGSRVTASTSTDGTTWTAIGSTSIELGADVYVGIAVTSQDAAQSAVAKLSQVSVGGLPAGMRHRNVGGPARGGRAWQSEGTYTLVASAIAKGESHDQFHFAYRRLQGDVDVVARVASVTEGANAGVMIRESLAADSRHAALVVSGKTGYAFDRRAETGAASERTDGGPAGVPSWVKLVRRGSGVEVFRSSDGLTWTSIGTGPIAATGDVYVGLAVSSDAAEATAVLDQVSIGPAGSPDALTLPILPNLPPVVTLTSPGNGATFTAPATITMSALATDPELSMAQVEFYANGTLVGADSTSPYSFTWSSAPAGSYTLTAVATDAGGAHTTSAAVSITVQPGPNELPTVSLTSPANGATFTAPATIAMTASASDPENRLARVEFYRDGTLLGTASSSPYSFTWSSAPAGSYSLTARAFDSDGGQTTSAAVSITVEAPNQPPSVALTSPADGATFTAPATIAMTASASDPENRLARVEFYRDGTLVGTDSSSPYSFTWSSAPAGSYSLTAKAFDSDGAQTTSSAVTVTVNAPPAPDPAPRLIAMTASADHDENVDSYLLEVFASGADPETASPVASSDLGKPTPDASREISVDRSAFFAALAPGNYIATVKAIGPGGTARSTAVAFTR